MILARERFCNCRVGCCGKVRNDSIFPIVGVANVADRFKVLATRIVEKYDGDVWYLEFYETNTQEDFRGKHPTLYEFYLDNGEWIYKIKGVEQFRVKNIGELRDIWK